MKKQLIIILLFLISINLVSAYECYQETATTSTSCGGLNTGNYTQWGSWAGGASYTLYDGNWNTYRFATGIGGWVNFTYAKPIGSLNTSLWRVKNSLNITETITKDLIITQSCWYANETYLILNVFEDGSQNSVYWNCWNGTEFENLNTTDTTGGALYVYEEAMLWDMYNFLENSQTYTTPKLENTESLFKINVTIGNVWTNQLAYLNYNHTKYSASITLSGSNYIGSKTITTPSVGATQNIPFVWEFALTNSTGTYWFNSSNLTQSVIETGLSLCTPALNVSFINFTIQDQNTFTKINSSFKIAFTGEGLDYSYEDTTETNSSFAFCFSPPDESYNISASIEYEASSYEKNYYYLNNYQLTNITTNLTLYLLNDTLGDAIVIRVQDESKKAIEDVYVSIQKYDAGTGTFYTVGMAESDFNGEDVVYLNYYDTYYRYSLVKNNELLLLTNTSKIYSSPVRLTVRSDYIFSYEKFNNIAYTLTFNNVTKNFILSYTDVSGDIATACLLVVRRSINNDTVICSNCESSSSATIYCDISTYGNGTYIATFYATGSLGAISFLEWIEGGANEIYTALGIDATFYAFLLAVIILAVFLVNPVLGVIGVILGIFAGAAIGFQPVNYMEFVGITIIGGIVISLLGSKR